MRRGLLGLTMLLALSACGKGLTVVSDYCAIGAPIGYDSKKDSPETVRAVEAHNSKWVCVCEKDCPK